MFSLSIIVIVTITVTTCNVAAGVYAITSHELC